MLSNVMRLELAEWGISVSLLEPAYVKTEIAKKQVGSNAKWKSADPELLPLYREWAEMQDAKRAASDKVNASLTRGPPFIYAVRASSCEDTLTGYTVCVISEREREARGHTHLTDVPPPPPRGSLHRTLTMAGMRLHLLTSDVITVACILHSAGGVLRASNL